MRYHLKLAVFIGLVLCLSMGIAAQEDEETPKWKGDLGLSLAINRGNSETTNFSFTFNATGKLSEKIEWVNNGIFQYARTDEVTSAELYQLGTRINWNHTERIFSYYDLAGIRDQFKNYAYRILPGVGAGYKLVNLEYLSFSLKGGLSYVFTKYYDTEETDSFLGIVISDEFAWKFSDTAELNQKWDINLDTSNSKHYLSYFEVNLLAQLIKSWSVKLTFINRYDSQPVGEGIKKSDSSFLAGISWKF